MKNQGTLWNLYTSRRYLPDLFSCTVGSLFVLGIPVCLGYMLEITKRVARGDKPLLEEEEAAPLALAGKGTLLLFLLLALSLAVPLFVRDAHSAAFGALEYMDLPLNAQRKFSGLILLAEAIVAVPLISLVAFLTSPLTIRFAVTGNPLSFLQLGQALKLGIRGILGFLGMGFSLTVGVALFLLCCFTAPPLAPSVVIAIGLHTAVIAGNIYRRQNPVTEEV